MRILLLLLGVLLVAYLFLPSRGQVDLRGRLRRSGRAVVVGLAVYWLYLLLLAVI